MPSRDYTETKLIHDPIWGTNLLYPWEVAILDTKLLQRLRHIRQTGLAYFVYPTANHSRFDHTLGVLAAASKYFQSIKANGEFAAYNLANAGDEKKKFKLEEIELMYIAVRIAALIHDVGHSLLSHSSEAVYEKLPPFDTLRDTFRQKMQCKSGAGEILAYYICISQRLSQYIEGIQFPDDIYPGLNLDGQKISKLLPRAAEFIIGQSIKPEFRFCAEIINGPIDADKLDYIRRDGYFAGLPIGYDLDRLLHSVKIADFEEDDEDVKKLLLMEHEERFKEIKQDDDSIDLARVPVRLILPMRAVNSLEQIIFSKFMLYPYIYHHQKIRAAESQFVQILSMHGKVFKLNNAIDYLLIDDRDLERFSKLKLSKKKTGPRDRAIATISNISERKLLYRAVVIDSQIVKEHFKREGDAIGGLLGFKDKSDAPTSFSSEVISDLFSEIKKEIKKHPQEYSDISSRPLELENLVLDLPSQIKADQFSEIILKNERGELKNLFEVFPLPQWRRSYYHVKWRGYVFCPRPYQKVVYKCFVRVFNRHCKTNFSETGHDFKSRSGPVLHADGLFTEIDYEDR